MTETMRKRLKKFQDGIYYVVLADLVESTSDMKKMGNDAGGVRLSAFERAARQALEFITPSDSGLCVKADGDAVLLVFTHFPDIVQWYLEFDGVLNRDLIQKDPMRARVWVHAGEVRFKDSDIKSLAVSQLFKIEKKAKTKTKAGNLVLTHLAREIAKPALFPIQVELKRFHRVKLEDGSVVELYRLVTKADIAFLLEKQYRDKRRSRRETQ